MLCPQLFEVVGNFYLFHEGIGLLIGADVIPFLLLSFDDFAGCVSSHLFFSLIESTFFHKNIRHQVISPLEKWHLSFFLHVETSDQIGKYHISYCYKKIRENATEGTGIHKISPK